MRHGPFNLYSIFQCPGCYVVTREQGNIGSPSCYDCGLFGMVTLDGKIYWHRERDPCIAYITRVCEVRHPEDGNRWSRHEEQ